MILLETCLKGRHVDLKINRLRPIRVEKFPGADLWHFYLTRTLNSAMFLIASQPGAIVWSAQEGPSHPPISHRKACYFHYIDGGLFNFELLRQSCKCAATQAKLTIFLRAAVTVVVVVCLRVSVCVCVCVFEGIHMVGAGNSWGGVYWTGCHSTWKIWRHQLATWGKRTASTQLGSILGLIVFEASIEELESSGSSPDSSSMKGGRRRPS